MDNACGVHESESFSHLPHCLPSNPAWKPTARISLGCGSYGRPEYVDNEATMHAVWSFKGEAIK